ncbi:hypothetical protein [Shewanella surugensis]|uniref:Uncharacterized protein n=1 Tax=Shewanella surugensis TaxID=212020 RepID=A0ABT0LBI5_9GAMM|nr:hypothetical protein [Shewanella surugensis]MCL1125051.1 hypothetical protein [Shewanella surugensis]
MTQFINNLVTMLKASATQLDDSDLYKIMLSHYQTLRLIDNDLNWASPELSELSQQLLPSDINSQSAIDLLDEMKTHILDNPYLVDFFNMAEHTHFTQLKEKSAHNARQIIPSVIGYALVQQRLTHAMYQHWSLINILMKIWVPLRQQYGIESQLSTFESMKLASIEKPMNDYIQFHHSGSVPQDYARLDLPMNIFEAVAEDLSAHRFDNAKAGTVLAFHLPGVKPARFSQDEKGILLTMPHSKSWADLYSLWNMAFVSHLGHFPFLMVKLLIPQVNNVKSNPELYLYNRTLALYTHLHFAFFGQFDRLLTKQADMDWYDETLTQLLGQCALKSAKEYEYAVKTNM